MHIDSHFDSGNIEVVELLDNNTAKVALRQGSRDASQLNWEI